MSGLIDLKNIYVWGVDTHARAASLRQWFIHRKAMTSVRIPIIQGVDFAAKPGDRIAIIGQNGCGKSSLLKVISGNYPIHEGTRRVEGSVVPLIEMGAGFEAEMSGRYNIKLSYAYRGKLREYSKEIEKTIIEFSELGEKIDLPLKTYSSGMMARLAFASAIFQDPDILLLDEIFATGDAGFIEKSQNILRKKVDNVSIAIMVNHSPNEFTDLCNRFILMHKGRIVNEGSRKEILHQYYTDILHISDERVVA
ncbi:MAG TPA: ABC transporter ATP-binding protein [Rickettsiales bacterium]|nr:ABC transporter ATP-binding protein [Rickettsiales bacterium]